MITRAGGLSGDYKGARHPARQITILAVEDWYAAVAELGETPQSLPWTTRRANVLVEGLRLPRVKGARLRLAQAELEVTGQTYPCRRMDEAACGLLKALAKDWRGGVTCRVLSQGEVYISSPAQIISSPPENVRKLP